MISGWFLLFFPLLAVSEGYNAATPSPVYVHVEEIKNELGEVIGTSSVAIANAGELQNGTAYAVVQKVDNSTTELRGNTNGSIHDVQQMLKADPGLFIDFWRWDERFDNVLNSAPRDLALAKDFLFATKRNNFFNMRSRISADMDQWMRRQTFDASETQSIIHDILTKFHKEAQSIAEDNNRLLSHMSTAVDNYGESLRNLSRGADRLVEKIKRRGNDDVRRAIPILQNLSQAIKQRANYDSYDIGNLLKRSHILLKKNLDSFTIIKNTLFDQPVMDSIYNVKKQLNNMAMKMSEEVKKISGTDNFRTFL